jgi:hypothetical protein
MTLDLFTFAVLVLATHRITRLITTDTIFSALRERIWNKFPPNRVNLGYLITCDWCSSLWAATMVFSAYFLAPTPTFVVSLVLATSSIVGILAARVN